MSFLSATRFEVEVRSLRTIYRADRVMDNLKELIERTPVFVTKSFILPIEILDRTLQYLDFATLQNIMNVSRQWHMLGLRTLKNQLRSSIEALKELLPKLDNGEIAMLIHNDHWKCYYRPPVPVSMLNQRLSKLIIGISNAQTASSST
ncbi:hypothetical protein K493DRAFT_308427 [Basidiobolus meristosporus CBS 931.73]|uniref:F-box domain-containing protein n=1 Tax=Basidiobolus meristosporus CBS 931.73 TaxID=1314790 RepID=A0A1Y1X2M6_9FUNG|nr:hypothetical protein K493DRAFT_308427 [Basidiobolus meristosporus CBS 931.73]|eukprot:ORX80051.1 hypothetical protein K493DRAFT_308427 [Basidiobolus meristosporus CBS 931.73]